jgi:tetratricopeptide (TPR) repeat protein
MLLWLSARVRDAGDGRTIGTSGGDAQGKMIKRYEDFEVIVTQKNGHLYADLGVVPSGRRLAQPVPITIPVYYTAWTEARQGRLSGAELAELGSDLFYALISSEIASEWNVCLSRTRRRPATGLRLRFTVRTDALADVPLELLCAHTAPVHEFLALDAVTPVVRSPRCGAAIRERLITPPLKMLVVIASSGDQALVDPVAEKTRLETAFADLVESGMLIIDYLGLPDGASAEYDTLCRNLVRTEYPYDVVHFIEAGDRDEGDPAKTEPLARLPFLQTERSHGERSDDLVSILAYTGVRVVFLQGYENPEQECTFDHALQDMAKELIARGLPAVVTLTYPMDLADDVAARFYRRFYDSWMAESGVPVEFAVAEARESMYGEFGNRLPSWWMPQLFICQESARALRIELARQPLGIYLKRGRVLLAGGRVDEAVEELQRAYEMAPDEIRLALARAHVAQAQAREESGDEDGALAACEQALEIYSDEQTAREMKVSIWARRGDSALVRGDLDDALAAYQQAGDRLRIEQVRAIKREEQASSSPGPEQSVSDVGAETVAIEPSDIAEIERHLKEGEEHINASDWRAASIDFEQGLRYYRSLEISEDPGGELAKLHSKLEMGILYAQGMSHVSQREWRPGIEAFATLQQMDASYLGVDLAERLEQARQAERRERAFNNLLTLVQQESWTDVLRLAATWDASYEGPGGESVGEILRHTLYAWGRDLEARDPGRAYYLLYDVYRETPGYEDVADLCAAIAFRNGTRRDIPINWEQKVDWLEKAVEIDPDHRTGRTRRLLDNARHQWARELLVGNGTAAIRLLEGIGPDYDQWVEVSQTLADKYYELLQEGKYVRTKRSNLNAEAEARSRLAIERWEQEDWQGTVEQLEKIPQEIGGFPSMSALAQVYVAMGRREWDAGRRQEALDWWKKALVISPGLGGDLRWRIREAEARLWISANRGLAGVIGAACVVLVVMIAILRARATTAVALPTPTPTPGLSATLTETPSVPVVLDSSPTATVTPGPELTATPTAQPETPTPTATATPPPTPSPSPSPSPSPTATPSPTLTPTSRPVAVSPRQVRPERGMEVRGRDPVTFEWDGSLGSGQAFRVILRHVPTGEISESAALTTPTWTVTLVPEKYGEYRWQVVVLEDGAVVASSTEEWHFWYNPLGSSGGPGEGPPPTQPPP